jgi:hypothetical protein
MSHDAIADARDRWAEQFMSDERLLGAVPEEAARLLLDVGLCRLDAAAARAADVAELDAAAGAILRDLRRLVASAEATADPVAFVRAALRAGGVRCARRDGSHEP